MTFRPYLFFPGSCRAAFEFYHQVFGGRLDLVTAADMPGEAPSDVPADLIMHAALVVDDTVLMGSDDPTSSDPAGVRGIRINRSLPDAATAARVFDALAAGGTVEMPLEQTSWSAAFGMCTDRFGTPWMIDVEGRDGR